MSRARRRNKLRMAGGFIRFPWHHLIRSSAIFGENILAHCCVECGWICITMYYVIQVLNRTFWTEHFWIPFGIKTKIGSSVPGSRQILDAESTEKQKGRIWAQHTVCACQCLFLIWCVLQILFENDRHGGFASWGWYVYVWLTDLTVTVLYCVYM